MMIDQFVLEKYLYSEEHKGLVFRFDSGRHGRYKAGAPSGRTGNQSGKTVIVLNTRKPESNVVWFLHHNEWPNGKLNHINGDPLDNRIENLFIASKKDGQRHKKVKLTQDRLKQLLSYDHDTGVFCWLVNKSQSSQQGDIAGVVNHSTGYVMIGVDGTRCRAHRIAWLYCHGEMPKPEIDHINGIRSDNRLENLRLVTRSQNSQNSIVRSDSPFGVKGVYQRKDTMRYVAILQVDGLVKRLGCFLTLNEAIEARTKAEKEFHPFRRI